MNNLQCFYYGRGETHHNFTEIERGNKGFSRGRALSSRNAGDGFLILLHDSVKLRGCMAVCDHQTYKHTIVSSMIHHMVNRWGSLPGDIDVLIAGSLFESGDFTAGLMRHLEMHEIGGVRVDARPQPSGPLLGQPIDGPPPQHIFYNPRAGLVELVADDDIPGGRAFDESCEVCIQPVC